MSLFTKKDGTFYDLLDQQAQTAHKAASALAALANDFSKAAQCAQAVDRIEDEGDELAHSMANQCDAAFVTPMDKEDLRALSGALDDITDNIDACSARIAIYRIAEPRPDYPYIMGLLVDCTKEVIAAIGALRNLKARNNLQSRLIRIHDLENKADVAFRGALAELFNEPGADPIAVMKWKEVYDRIERAVDKCEEVATLVESVVVKYA